MVTKATAAKVKKPEPDLKGRTETDYLKLARTKAFTVKTQKSWRRIHVYARNKKGKTRLGFSAGRDNVLIIDPEKGTALMKQLDPFVWPVVTWEDLQEAYGALRTGKLAPNHIKQGESSTPFSWVSVDGCTRINNMALKFVMAIQEMRDLDRQPGFVDRRDYNKSGELMKQFFLNMHSLPMNVYFSSQERMIGGTDTDDDEDSETSDVFYVADLPAAPRATINAFAEVTGRLYTARIEVKGKEVKQRRLQIGEHPKYDTGFRSDWALPDMIKRPTLPALVKLIEEGEAA